MQAVVFHGIGDIRLEDVPEPKIRENTDAIVRITTREEEDPVADIMELTGGIGVYRVIDAVGVDAVCPHRWPAAKQAKKEAGEFERELKKVAPRTSPDGPDWHPGDAPSQALRWAVQSLAKAGTHAIIGVYPQNLDSYPIGMAMNRNLTIKTGNCNHRKYVRPLLDLVESGATHPEKILAEDAFMSNAIDAYKAFDRREPWWIKVILETNVQRGRQSPMVS